MDIICRKLANDMIYAYHAGRFWRWDDTQRTWKESHLMAAKFERARAALKTLTPEAFFSDGAEFALLDEYEISLDMAEALRIAKPCKNAPIDPVEESPTLSAQCSDAATAAESQTAASPAVQAVSTPTTETAVAVQSSAALGSADESTPAPSNTTHSFDYSGLDAQTVDVLHMAEGQYAQGKKMTEVGLRWMVNAVSMAHDALCGGACATVVQAHNNQHSDDTFKAWCESIGISRSSAYNLLRVAEQFGSIEIDGKSILDVQPATLLYEAAKPSAPAELVQKVTTGEITSSAEYRAVLKENQQLRTDRVNALNQAEREKQRAENALAEIGERDKAIKSLLDRSEEADARADSMESKYKATLSDVQGLKNENAQLIADKDQAEERVRNAEEALKHQPIVGIVDEEEVDRRAAEKAWGLADARNAELAKDNADMKKQIAALNSKISDAAQSDFENANNIAFFCRRAWDTGKGSYSRLVGEDLETTFASLCETLNSIREEAARLCRQPPEYDGGEEDE